MNNPLDTFDPESPAAKLCRSQPLGVHTLHSSPTNPRKTFDEKAKKSTPETTAEALLPPEAAQAADDLRAKFGLAVGDRVRIRMDIDGTPNWKKKVCGREGVIEKIHGEGAGRRGSRPGWRIPRTVSTR